MHARCCRRAHRLRTASSERPGSSAAIIRHLPPSRVTPLRIASSSHAAHSLRWPSLLLPLASPAPVSSGWEANAAAASTSLMDVAVAVNTDAGGGPIGLATATGIFTALDLGVCTAVTAPLLLRDFGGVFKVGGALPSCELPRETPAPDPKLAVLLLNEQRSGSLLTCVMCWCCDKGSSMPGSSGLCSRLVRPNARSASARSREKLGQCGSAERLRSSGGSPVCGPPTKSSILSSFWRCEAAAAAVAAPLMMTDGASRMVDAAPAGPTLEDPSRLCRKSVRVVSSVLKIGCRLAGGRLGRRVEGVDKLRVELVPARFFVGVRLALASALWLAARHRLALGLTRLAEGSPSRASVSEVERDSDESLRDSEEERLAAPGAQKPAGMALERWVRCIRE